MDLSANTSRTSAQLSYRYEHRIGWGRRRRRCRHPIRTGAHQLSRDARPDAGGRRDRDARAQRHPRRGTRPAGRRCRQHQPGLFGLCRTDAGDACGPSGHRRELRDRVYQGRGAERRHGGAARPAAARLFRRFAGAGGGRQRGRTARRGAAGGADRQRWLRSCRCGAAPTSGTKGTACAATYSSPFPPYVAATGGIGYERIETSQRQPVVDATGFPVVDGNGRFVTDTVAPAPDRLSHRRDLLRRRRHLAAQSAAERGSACRQALRIGELYGDSSPIRHRRASVSRRTCTIPSPHSASSCAPGSATCRRASSRRATPIRSSITAASSARRGRRPAGASTTSSSRSRPRAIARAAWMRCCPRRAADRRSGPASATPTASCSGRDTVPGVTLYGIEDQSYYAQGYYSRELTPVSALGANIFVNYYDPGFPRGVRRDQLWRECELRASVRAAEHQRVSGYLFVRHRGPGRGMGRRRRKSPPATASRRCTAACTTSITG